MFSVQVLVYTTVQFEPVYCCSHCPRFSPRYDPPSVAAVLSDKSHLKRTRDLYKNFEYETNDHDECLDNEGGAEDYQKLYLFDQYNDEYDDTYDSHNVGVSDSVTTDEVFAVKRYTVHVCMYMCMYLARGSGGNDFI